MIIEGKSLNKVALFFMKHHSYNLSLDQLDFGILLSTMPVLRESVRNGDKETWGRFKISHKGEINISWVQRREIMRISEIFSSLIFTKAPEGLLFIPSCNGEIDYEFLKSEKEFCYRFISIYKEYQFDFENIYAFPENPNTNSPETVQSYKELISLKENGKKLSNDAQLRIIELCESFFPSRKFAFLKDSALPSISFNGNPEFSPSIYLIKFISYFKYFFKAIPAIITIMNSFGIDSHYMPSILESFTLERIPSLVANHNILERIGDSVIDIVVSSSVVRAMIESPNLYINQQIRIIVSNRFFKIIGHQYQFEKALIGPEDQDKVVGDCLESLIGFVFLNFGYEYVCDFWKKMLFTLPITVIQELGLTKAIESLKLGVESKTFNMEPAKQVPKEFSILCNNLIMPPERTFSNNDEFSIKCKLIGTSVYKHCVVIKTIQQMIDKKNLELIKTYTSKTSMDQVAINAGLSGSKKMREFLGGLFLQNGYLQTMDFLQSQIITKSELKVFHIYSNVQ